MTTNFLNYPFVPLIFLAYALGLRHGFDLDHLATIDSIARNLKKDIYLSKLTGFFFSLGHGIVVILISLVFGSGLIHASSPIWLESFGNWVSIFFLLLFGCITLWNTFSNSSKLPTGFKSYFFQKLIAKKCNAFLIILIGALFALSFDTFTQVALFSISATVVGNLIFCSLLGIFFMLGMMTSDGLNGILISTFIQFADKYSLWFSRIVGLSIASFSLVLGLLSLFSQLTA